MASRDHGTMWAAFGRMVIGVTLLAWSSFDQGEWDDAVTSGTSVRSPRTDVSLHGPTPPRSSAELGELAQRTPSQGGDGLGDVAASLAPR